MQTKKALHYIALLLLLTGIASAALAQPYKSLDDDQKEINRLEVLYQMAHSDSLKCILGFKLASIYSKNNQEKRSKFYLSEANKRINGKPFLNDLSYYYNHAMHPLPVTDDTAQLQFFQNQYEQADLKLKKYQNQQAYSIRATILFNLALVHQRRNNDLEAVKILLHRALPVATQANDSVELANIYRFLGLIFYNKDQIEKARYYVALAIKTLELHPANRVNYSEDLLQFYLFYVEILSLQQKLPEASAYLKKAEDILRSHPESNLMMDYYVAQGSLWHQYKEDEKAIAVYNKGIKKAQDNQDAYMLLNLKLLKFESLKTLRESEQAKELLLEVLNDKQVNIEDRKTYTKELALIYEKLQDYQKALFYSERYIALSDSLEAISGKSEIANLEAKFKNKENDRRIKELESQKKQAMLAAKYDRLHYIVLALISFILFLVALFLIKNAKSLKRIARQKEINYQQNLEGLRFQKELEVMQATISGEEAERKRIARDLHDGIGSRLSALKMQLQSLASAQHANPNWKDLSDSLSVSIIELRQIAFNLLPETITKLGLELALKDLCHWLSSEKCLVTFQGHEISPKMTAQNQLAIFRIVQELVSNALKHSGATEIIVDCSQNQQLFLITVEDNGNGFNTNDFDIYNGLGLKNIRNRIELLNGKWEIDSVSGKGSVFNIELLLQENDT